MSTKHSHSLFIPSFLRHSSFTQTPRRGHASLSSSTTPSPTDVFLQVWCCHVTTTMSAAPIHLTVRRRTSVGSANTLVASICVFYARKFHPQYATPHTRTADDGSARCVDMVIYNVIARVTFIRALCSQFTINMHFTYYR